MVILDDDIYRETKDIILGKRKPSALVIEVSDWFRSRYSIKVLNIQFREPYRETGRPTLCVITENTADHNKMYIHPAEPNETYQKQIAHEFRKLALKHKFIDESKLDNLYVTYNDFSEEAKTEANWHAAEEVRTHIKSRWPSVWDVSPMFSSSVVFYYTDADVAANENNGISEAITYAYFSVLKKYDELNYFSMGNILLRFDSKENLDQHYAGNMLYYMT